MLGNMSPGHHKLYEIEKLIFDFSIKMSDSTLNKLTAIKKKMFTLKLQSN